ncbi:germinal-center associated nuclear protein isoform X4 [Leptidea sinapis]|uniref:germinal-center associated nuclear protein isoform X3 n=1 Tax=Leptidea sinapis TaxID=189913 RepID=UPI0021C43372|nr:germinal-center associated nuclear protein isoform X3 [Leptidea sinapis]XP_050663927.1 germinal-center associated nuclear protein isoform X4 [Leptidea sinapis]
MGKLRRIRERMINILETFQGEYKLVKCFSRSAADSKMAVPEILRPYPILKKTMHHLLHVVSKRTDVTTTTLYNFIDDRLRAVRQDMTIQRLPLQQCAELLEPMIRFYIYFAYRLSARPVHEFDPVLNKTYLLECMKWYLSCEDRISATEENMSVNDLADCFKMMELNSKNLGCRVLIESLYIMCNLDNIQPIFRYLRLPLHIKRTPLLKLAYEVAIANLKGNFVRVCRLAQSLCPLNKCAFYLYLPSLQRCSLHKLSTAYNSKQLSVPTAAVQHWILFTDSTEVEMCCKHYGLAVDQGVRFNKTMFKEDVEMYKPQLNNLKLPEFEEMLTYTSDIKINC